MFSAIRPVRKRSFTIAILEDHRDTRDWMWMYLQEECFVSAHETARDLLVFISTNHCDLILSDISLPEMDGYALVASIRSNPLVRHLRIIAVSAHINQRTAKGRFKQASTRVLRSLSIWTRCW